MRASALRSLLVLALCGLSVAARRGLSQASDKTQAELLLSLPKACPNWAEKMVNITGADWVAGTSPCGANGQPAWKGVTCDGSGQVVKLSIGGLRIRCPSLPGQLARLPALQVLDLKCNAILGTVPREWTAPGAFPVLQNLNLADNLMKGALSDFTMADSGRMMASGKFNVSRNSLDASPLPTTWSSSSLTLLDVSYNRVPGTLPLQWGQPTGGQRSAFPALQILAVQGNELSGVADPWPGGALNVFADNFTMIARPGNGLLEGTIPTAAPPPAESSSSGLSTGATVGIAVGAAAGVALAAAAVLFVVRRRRQHGGTAAAAAAAVGADASAHGKGWGKDMESGGASDSAAGSAWSSLGGSAMKSGMRDSAMGSRASGGSGSMALGHDTDVGRLPPAEWTTVDFNDLELSKELGHGSFGNVYLAKYCQTMVAVKMLAGGEKKVDVQEEAHQRAIIRQLEKEASIMAQLRHTNITLYMGACANPPCLLMEYCARRSLDKLLAAGLRDAAAAASLTWPRLLSMALDAARGMLYLHTRTPAICHRDLKSANLLVTSAWQVKVADFNLSRAVEAATQMSSVVVQNPRWLAPERLVGSQGGLASDVWSFGTVLWELMTWEAPHGDQNAYQIIHAVQSAAAGAGLPVPPPDALPAGPLAQFDAYVALMRDCWHRDPEQRPTMDVVATRLRNILAAEVGRPSLSNNMRLSVTGSGTVTLGSAPGSAPLTTQPTAAISEDGGASPFAAAEAMQRAPSMADPSPFAAAAAVQRAPSMGANPSPFAAAAAVQPAPSMGANPSPFAALAAVEPAPSMADPLPFAGAAAFRAPSMTPERSLEKAETQDTAAAAPRGPNFDAATDSVIASFARMEQVQRQLSSLASSRSASMTGRSPQLSRATSGLGSGKRAPPSRMSSSKSQATSQ